jgi:hypothetical protein
MSNCCWRGIEKCIRSQRKRDIKITQLKNIERTLKQIFSLLSGKVNTIVTHLEI